MRCEEGEDRNKIDGVAPMVRDLPHANSITLKNLPRSQGFWAQFEFLLNQSYSFNKTKEGLWNVLSGGNIR